MKILLIDDDPVTLEFLKKGLEDKGHSVVTAASGYEALCVLENEHFEFVICDVFMPQISGLVVANIITHYFGSSLPLLLMSSNKLVGVFIRDQVRPGWDFVEKPISAAELHQFITNRMPGLEAIRPN